MEILDKTYRGLTVVLATIAGIMVGLIFVIIVMDVGMRATGLQPPDFSSAAVEYLVLYTTCLAAPWLLRMKGHVFVESFIFYLPERARRVQEKCVYVLCIALCLLFVFYGMDLLIGAIERGDMDERSITVPRWLSFAPIPVAFGLMIVEFFRFLLGRDSMYRRSIDQQEIM